MPLLPGKKAIGPNISTEEEAGKPPQQAEAIALNTARKTSADMPKRRRLPPLQPGKMPENC